MAKDDLEDTPPPMHPERRAKGFEPIGAVIARLMRKAGEQRDGR
ncbi:hypothetical protein [Amaricoccus solimangrovi]|nr:hypothetical protein [Amaricoccus solimangrovi]